MNQKKNYSPEQKLRIYKYVNENREKINEYNSTWKKEHKEIINKGRMKNYYNKKYYDYEAVAKIFRKILI